MDSATQSKRVSRKRRERRNRIIEAAFEAIAEMGPAEFSMNQLARDLDYTPGALYWYFPSKEALVAIVQQRALADLAEWLAADQKHWAELTASTRHSEPVRLVSTLLRLASHYLGLADSAPQHTRIVAFSLDPRIWLGDEDAKALVPVLRALFEPAAQVLEQAEVAGVLAPGQSSQRAVQYWTALQGTLQTAKLSRIAPDLFDPYVIGMRTAETLLRGWGAPADVVDKAHDLLQRLAKSMPY